jgi:hypothetical protein
VGDVYTDEQREFVKARREALSARLKAVETKIAGAFALEDDEKALVLKVTDVAGAVGIIGASDRVRSPARPAREVPPRHRDQRPLPRRVRRSVS